MKKTPFFEWCAQNLPDPADTLAVYFDNLRNAAASVGALLDDKPILDGSWHYLPNLSGRKDQKQSYRARIKTDNDGTVWPVVTFHSFKAGGLCWKPREIAWQQFMADRDRQSVSNGDLVDNYRERAKIAQINAQNKAAKLAIQKAEGQKAAAAIALSAWDAGKLCDNHPYLDLKGVTDARDVRIATADVKAQLWSNQQSKWQIVTAVKAGELLIRVENEAGELVNLQRIASDGEKRFLKGGKFSNCYSLIDGEMPRIFCEGWATGKTISAATGRAIVVTFSAGNLPKVVAKLAEPGDVVAADNDNAPKRDEGFGKSIDAYGTGHRAAMETDLPWFMPHTPGHDWNDAGIEATRAAFAGNSTSSAQIFNAWELQPESSKGKTADQWLKALSRASDPKSAADLALTAANRLFMAAPVHMSLAGIRVALERKSPAGLVHPATLDSIIKRLDSAMKLRKAAALSAVTIPPEIIARHRHQTIAELTVETLKPNDYKGVIVLWAPMASGKTRLIGAPFVKWAAQYSKPLAICHRVSLVYDMAAALGIGHYREVDSYTVDDPSLRGLAICLPSITVAVYAPLIEPAEYLFIDEISQVLRFLSARDHCRTEYANNEGVYNRLRELVSRASCLIVADAGCDARTIEFIESCRPNERFRIIEVKQKHLEIKAAYHPGKHSVASVIGDCLEELDKGGHIWLATESSKRVKVLEQFFNEKGYRVMAVNADNKSNAAQAAFLASPESESLKYDVVIASPVIGSGLSIAHREAGEWFTLGAFIGGGQKITPADAAQALRRVRYLQRFSLGLIPNSQVGRQSPEGIIEGWEKASGLDGKQAFPNDFTGLVAQIMASEDNARADFAAGLLWQLERAGWKLCPGESGVDGIGQALSEIKDNQDKAYRAELIAAPLMNAAEARQLEKMSARCELQNIMLEAYKIRQSLGVDQLDDKVLDFWDSGAAVGQLDRFSAWRGTVGGYDDSKENLANRKYHRALARTYALIFEGIDLEHERFTKERAEVILDRIISNRFLCARLGIVSKTYAVWMEDKKHNLLPFRKPANPRQELAEVLRRMGLKWKEISVRVAHTPHHNLLENIPQGVCKPATKNARVYAVTPGSVAEMQKWADRRNARRFTIAIPIARIINADLKGTFACSFKMTSIAA